MERRGFLSGNAHSLSPQEVRQAKSISGAGIQIPLLFLQWLDMALDKGGLVWGEDGTQRETRPWFLKMS